MPLHLIWAEDQAGGIGQTATYRGGNARTCSASRPSPSVMPWSWDGTPGRACLFPAGAREPGVARPSWSDEGAERTTIEEVKARSEAGETLFIIGGGEVYALMLPSEVFRTVVHTTAEGADTHAPPWTRVVESSNGAAQEGDHTIRPSNTGHARD